MILEAGDHNGSTFYQHQKFMRVVDGHQSPEVTLNDGIWAVRMGNAHKFLLKPEKWLISRAIHLE